MCVLLNFISSSDSYNILQTFLQMLGNPTFNRDGNFAVTRFYGTIIIDNRDNKHNSYHYVQRYTHTIVNSLVGSGFYPCMRCCWLPRFRKKPGLNNVTKACLPGGTGNASRNIIPQTNRTSCLILPCSGSSDYYICITCTKK